MAFLLALLDLILELQDSRKKRDVSLSIMERNATMATHSMFRGFLNVLDAEDENCAKTIFCESSHEAAKYGEIGRSIAKIARFVIKNLIIDYCW